MTHRTRLATVVVATTLMTAFLFACSTPPPPPSETPVGLNAGEREAYLLANPGLDAATRDAIFQGQLRAGLSEEEVLLVANEPATREALEGLYEAQWSYFSTRDTTWVFFKTDKVATIDGTAPLYRFPEIQRKRVVLRFVLPRRQTVVASLYNAQKKFLGELLHGTLEVGDHSLVLKMLEPKNDDIPLRPNGVLRAGKHELRWNARDADDNPLPDGLYFLRIESTDRNEMRRFSLIQ